MTASENPHYTKIDIILEFISIAALLVFLIYTILNWGSVPEKIPDHFNWSGLPDSWGSKGTAPVMLYVTAFIFILFTVISRFPRIINFPIRINEENSKPHLQLRFSLIMWIKAELVVSASYLGVQGIRVALGYSEGLGTLAIPLILAVLAATGAAFIYRASKLN